MLPSESVQNGDVFLVSFHLFFVFFSVCLAMQVALHFVKDERTRFSLALECGNIEVSPSPILTYMYL